MKDLSKLPTHVLRCTRDPVTLYPRGKVVLRKNDKYLSLILSTPSRLYPYLEKGKRQYRISLNTTDMEVALVRAEGHVKDLHRKFASADLKRVFATMEHLNDE